MNKKDIEKTIANYDEAKEPKVDWTKAWAKKYPVLAEYQKIVDIPQYSSKIRDMLESLQKDYLYSDLDAMLVLKDILAHEYLDKKKK